MCANASDYLARVRALVRIALCNPFNTSYFLHMRYACTRARGHWAWMDGICYGYRKPNAPSSPPLPVCVVCWFPHCLVWWCMARWRRQTQTERDSSLCANLASAFCCGGGADAVAPDTLLCSAQMVGGGGVKFYDNSARYWSAFYGLALGFFAANEGAARLKTTNTHHHIPRQRKSALVSGSIARSRPRRRHRQGAYASDTHAFASK